MSAVDGGVLQEPAFREGGETVEQEIQRKGLTAPRVTPADIEANIESEHYFTADDGCLGARMRAAIASASSTPAPVSLAPGAGPLSLLTICVLVLRNGFTVHGVSACASPENFNAELGRRIARENAVREMWPLMGYSLRERLHVEAAVASASTPERHENGDGT